MRRVFFGIATLTALMALPLLMPGPIDGPAATEAAFIVQATNHATAAQAVRAVGGEVTHELDLIDAVAARLTEAERQRLAHRQAVRRIWADGDLRIARGTPQPDTLYPTFVDAAPLHDQGIVGDGVTVAVLDTGTWEGGWISKNIDSNFRILTHYDAINDTTGLGSDDDNGHGTHVTSVILSSGRTKGRNKLYHGVAPDADLVVVRAFDVAGVGVYSNVIRGLDWVVANKDLYGIRVLNLSFSANSRSYYWDDPLNQAVMRAWQAGIVVVAAAGDAGPGPLSVSVPGNVPYVITVGAMSFNQTTDVAGDDFLAAFSSAGPTAEAFVKPDVLAPGVAMRGILRDDQVLVESAEAYLGNNTYELSGTSQAAAVVSGVVALMLDDEPGLDPDTVKCRIIATARPAANGPDLAYSVFQQGAGVVNAFDAVQSTQTGCANQGLDIAADLDAAGTVHYRGLADQDGAGTYFLANRVNQGTFYDWDGTLQSGTFPFVTGFAWAGGFPLSDPASTYPFVGGAPDGTVYPWLTGLPWINDPYPQVWTGGEGVTASVESAP